MATIHRGFRSASRPKQRAARSCTHALRCCRGPGRQTRNQHWENAMKTFTALIAIVGFTALMGATAEAATPSDAPAEAVRYVQPNAANSRDVAILYARIDAAA